MPFPTLKELGQRPYAKQCAFFINGFWGKCIDGTNVNAVYDIYEKFVELDKNKERGNELDEFDAHRLLESFGETLSVKDMRDTMKLIDQDFNTFMSAIEYLTFKFGKTVKEVVESPQGDNSKVIAAAQEKLRQVQVAIEDVQTKLDLSKEAVKEATESHNKAVHEESVLVGLQAELKAAVSELSRVEEDNKRRIETLQRMVVDMSLGPVKRNKSAAELEQAKCEDSLPLRKAKITQEAALRKVTKQKVNAELSTQNASTTKAAAEEAKANLEAAYAELETKMREAADEVEEAKALPGVANGDFYFLERGLFIADCSLPVRKQKYDHTKPFKYTPPN